jgi:signal transduction histidine kinase
MSLLPQSLFARLFTALLGVVIVTLLMVAALIARERRELAFLGTGAWNTTKAIADTSGTLAKLDAGARSAAIDNLLHRPLLIDDLRRRRPPPRMEEMRAIQQSFTAQLRRQLGPAYGVDVQRASPANTQAIRVEGARWSSIAPRVGRGAAPAPARESVPEPGDSDGSAPVPGRMSGPVEPAGAAPEAPSAAIRGNSSGAAPEGSSGPIGADARGAMLERPPGLLRRARLFNWFYDVTVTLPDGGRVMFRTLAPLPAPPLPRQIFVELGVLTVLLGLTMFVMARTITRPLRDLANAADAVGRGANHPPLAEKGARELRRATRAFNTMQERLRRYLDSRTRVLAAMSHDLRTTLTRLRLRAESIENEELRSRFSADLDEMSQMVHGALGLFRGLNDEEPLDTVDVDTLLDTLRLEFEELGASVTIEGRTDGPLAAKPLALKRCLTNLLHNAIKYGTRATVHIADGEELVIRIRDEGPGIPAEALNQVFEPFFRIEPSRNRDTGGTGLGLSIARDIAQAHGGSIVLNNLVGRGLEVVLTLPRAAAAAAKPTTPGSLERPASTASA